MSNRIDSGTTQTQCTHAQRQLNKELQNLFDPFLIPECATVTVEESSTQPDQIIIENTEQNTGMQTTITIDDSSYMEIRKIDSGSQSNGSEETFQFIGFFDTNTVHQAKSLILGNERIEE